VARKIAEERIGVAFMDLSRTSVPEPGFTDRPAITLRM